jgi:ABC-type transport system involved in multi-copper enzyme maturation permease subunit
MHIRLGSNQRGQALILWVVLLVLFVAFIGIIAYVCVSTVKRIVPQTPNQQGWFIPPHIGTVYDGGIITDEYYTYASNTPAVRPQVSGQTNVLIYASPSPFGPWTNLIWEGLIDDVASAMGSNGLPLETFSNGVPSVRFYNIMVSLPDPY